jgi:hypothetical protein
MVWVVLPQCYNHVGLHIFVCYVKTFVIQRYVRESSVSGGDCVSSRIEKGYIN